MKKIFLPLLTVAFGLTIATSCIDEVNPSTDYVTGDQAGNAPGSYDNFVNAVTSTLTGKFTYSGSSTTPYDYGYPSFFLKRDVMGQDIALGYSGSWYSTWYACGVGLGPQYAVCQYPWTYYYGWIKNCNTVLSLAGETPDEDKITGAGIAYAMRAMFYMDLARMYAPKTYGTDKNAETVPIVTETTSLADLANNPRATNEDIWNFIISDLTKAEEYLAGYPRSDIYTPDLSVVQGLKARAYLTMEDWSNAQKYAKLAQSGYSIMSETEYTSRDTGFNTPTASWMFGLTYKADDPNILENDADSSWGSHMILEIDPEISGCGYASNYGQQQLIDRHLYETIPATDFRKNCFVDFKLDELGTEAEIIDGLKAYSDYPDWVYKTGYDGYYGAVGGLSLKFRATGGGAGHENQYIGFVVAVPMMRVEEMVLIEAEAAGMQNEGNGIALLTAFAKTRDASYVYGTHTDTYGNNSTSTFQNEVWWQRRVELWGEGFATFDIKRLNKGIIRSYANSNHLELNRWNTTTTPDWMNWCIIQTETNFNYACTNNPTPVKPTSDSEEHSW
ncbi:RagB/SusD family nutrient uptake outer membrane protein [Bacteroides sp. 51]|uniref:RagB/SusD family nutrient uptake outer membrane protein n=1 Tax=Bacteroides sp. 51 TaxID=2302938 RepID=UPI0013D39091|nr:RagB/SusD family nutrient uptake outer membrane protein [Bacteroides sp. 51]NDV83012.1 RagB/SusD family nutrient uptake outer membrane protein [Bacteroides sp. 51]